MSWLSILKADNVVRPISVGKLNSRFAKGDIPSKDEIAQVTDQALQQRYIDTVITKIKADLAQVKQGKDVPESIVQRMITGERSKIADNREEAISKIEELLQQLTSLTGDSVNPLYEKEVSGIKYSDLVSPEGKTNKEWTIETLQELYNMMGTDPSVDLLYAIYAFINDSTDGSWTRDSTWTGKMGRELETNFDALKNIFGLRADPEVQGGIDRQIFNFFTDEYKYSPSGVQEMEVVSGKGQDKYGRASEKVRREGLRTKTKIVADPKTMEMTERTSERLLTAEDIGNKISNLTESQFTELVDKLQRTNSAEGLFEDIKNKSVGIVYDLGFKGQGINQLVRDIDVRRKGDLPSQRRKDYLHDWTISYINRKMNEANSEEIDIAGYKLLSRNALNQYQTKQDRKKKKYRDHYEQRDKLIDWIKEKVRSEDKTWSDRYNKDIKIKNRLDSEFRNLSPEEQEELISDRERFKEFYQMSGASGGADFAELAYSFNIDKGLSDFISMLDQPMNRFERNILALMFNSYMDLGSEGKDKPLAIIPSGSFVQYLPTGALFADATEESFIESMRALMTIMRKVLDRGQFSTYNVNMSLAINTFFENIEKYFAENGDTDTEEDRLESMIDFIGDGDFDTNSEDWFGTKQDLAESYEAINDLIIDLESGIKSSLINNIQIIADDTTDKYPKQGLRIRGEPAGIREYLIMKGFLRQNASKEEE